MSPEWSQPSTSVSAVFAGLVQISHEHVAATADDLAVVGDLHLAAGDRLPDVARLVALRRVRHRARRLGHAVDLRERHADRREPLEDRGRDRRRAAGRHPQLVEPDQLANGRERDRVEERPRVALVLGVDPGELGALDLDRQCHTVVELALLVGVGGERGVDAGVDLLVHAWHAEQELRSHVAEIDAQIVEVRGSSRPRSPASTCCSGSPCARRCAPSADTTRPSNPRCRAPRSSRAGSSTVYTTLYWLSITPLGGPVVPDV